MKNLGKPVVTSMQAFMWDMLNTAGESSTISGYGKLFSEPHIHPESLIPPEEVYDKPNNHESIQSVATTAHGDRRRRRLRRRCTRGAHEGRRGTRRRPAVRRRGSVCVCVCVPQPAGRRVVRGGGRPARGGGRGE